MPWLTPNVLPSVQTCRRLSIPADERIIAAVSGALLELTYPYNWEQYGTQTPADTAYAMLLMLNEFLNNEGCMIGLITPYVTVDVPPNCLPCDGSVHNRVDYPLLYERITPLLHVNADQFSTPDFRGRVIVSANADFPLYGGGGQRTVTLTVDNLPPHDHETSPHAHGEVIAVATVVNGGLEAPAASATPAPGTTALAGVTVLPTGGGVPFDNMPPHANLNYCIVAR